MSWPTHPAWKGDFAVLQPVVREELFSVPSADGHIVILRIAVGLLQFSLEIKCPCVPCSPLQEFKVRDDSKSCAEKPVGVWAEFVRMDCRRSTSVHTGFLGLLPSHTLGFNKK